MKLKLLSISVSLIFFTHNASAAIPVKDIHAVLEDLDNEITPKKRVTLLTLNSALLSVFFGLKDINLKNNTLRAKWIGQTIRTLNNQPDVIVLQEAFDRKALHSYLYKEIKDLYPYTFFDTRYKAYFGSVDSGLAIFSKYPIIKKMQKDFSCWAGVEALARKGIMGVQLSVDGCPLYIFTAHFQAGVDKAWYIKLAGLRSRSCEGKNPNKLSSSEIIHMELRQAKREIDAFVKHKNAPILFAGDFNISRTRDEKDYFKFKEIFPQALDTYYNGLQIIKSSSWEKGKVAKTETDRVDYVWLLNPSESRWAESNIITNFTSAMTDHLGIMATLEFDCE